MATIEDDHGQIFYNIQGSGKPIVILRGLSFSIKHWLGFDRELAKHFKVITMDHRGISQSKAKVSWSLSMSDLARDVTKVLDHNNIESAHILGMSLGGMAALAMGLEFSRYCQSITVVGSSIAGTGSLRLSREAVVRLAKCRGYNQKTIEALSDLLLHPDANPAHREKARSSWTRIAQEDGFHRLTTMKQLIAASRFNVGQKLKTMRIPTLVTYGDGDLFVPPVNSFQIYQKLPNARLVKIEGAGHEVSLEKPAELIGAIQQFTKSLPKAPGLGRITPL